MGLYYFDFVNISIGEDHSVKMYAFVGGCIAVAGMIIMQVIGHTVNLGQTIMRQIGKLFSGSITVVLICLILYVIFRLISST